MTELFSRYESGLQFTAGTMIGSVMGVSGINPIVDRLNSISNADNLLIGSMISGTSTFVSVGSIIMTSGLFTLESRTSDPTTLVTGRMWIRSDL